MRQAVFSILLMALVTLSCSRSRSDIPNDRANLPRIKDFLNKIQEVPVGYKYDLQHQDSEGFYQTSKIDSLFFSEYISVIGFFPDTSRHYSILYLEPGDDLYPSIKVFSKDGELTDSKTVCYADCAAGDCGMDSCSSFIQVASRSSIKRSILLVSAKCDSLGNKIPGTSSKKEKSQVVVIDDVGHIKFDLENIR